MVTELGAADWRVWHDSVVALIKMYIMLNLPSERLRHMQFVETVRQRKLVASAANLCL